MVDRSVESEVVAQSAALVRAARYADRACTLGLGYLTDGGSDRPGRRSDDDCLARLRATNCQKPRVCGETRHAEDSERGRDRRRRGIEAAGVSRVGDRVRLPAGVRQDDIADLAPR